jgi:hypothetical protein
MSLTKPKNFDDNPNIGVDERDADNSMFEEKMPHLVKVVRPAIHKLVNDNLWVELLTGVSLLITGIGQFFVGMSTTWYIFVSVLLVTFIRKQLIINKTETTQTQNVEEVVELENDGE